MSERRPFIFILRLNIVLQNSCRAHEIVMGIEKWKQKDDYFKSFARVLLIVLETSIVSQRNYYMNFFVLQQFDYS